MGLRRWLSAGREDPLRETFIADVSRRSVGRVLRVGVSPTTTDRLTARLAKNGARTVPVVLDDPTRSAKVLREQPSVGSVVFEASHLDGTEAPCLQSLTRVAGRGQLLVLGMSQDSALAASLLLLQKELSGAAEAQGSRQRLVRGIAAVDTTAAGDGRLDALLSLKRSFHLVLAEGEANDHLRRVPEAGEVVRTIPAADLINTSEVEQSPAPTQHVAKSTYSAPELSLRLYRDVTAFPRQILTQPGLVLPDTFRKPSKVPLSHRTLQSAPADMRARPSSAQPRELDGSYFYLDSEFSGHFGHAITEQLSRLWAWRTVKEHDPDAKCLLLTRRPADGRPARKIAGFERFLYGAAGVDPDDLVLEAGAVAVERMYAATPMFAQPQYAHPQVAELWREVGDRLAAQAGEHERPRRIFCARKHGKRACHNGADVERLFADNGFDVIYPEDYPMSEQVALFRAAEVVAGYSGSALFTAMFCSEPKHMVMVSSQSYGAQNEYMIAAVLGHRVSVAWCRPDLEKTPGGGFDKAVFQSDFTFDFAREGLFVDELLSQL